MNVTPLAIEKLKEVMDGENEADSALRVVAMPAGPGLQYMLTMEKEHQPDDTVLRMDGVEFLMDSDSAPFLEEATIDYVEELAAAASVSSSTTPCTPAAAVAAADAVAVVAAVAAAAADAVAADTRIRASGPRATGCIRRGE